jgi:hypothetical protein
MYLSICLRQKICCGSLVPNGRQLHVIIDSAETIASNMQGNADAYKFLRDVFEIIRKRQGTGNARATDGIHLTRLP